jgi:hypothetical protein
MQVVSPPYLAYSGPETAMEPRAPQQRIYTQTTVLSSSAFWHVVLFFQYIKRNQTNDQIRGVPASSFTFSTSS